MINKSQLKLLLKRIVTETRLLEASIQDPTKDEMFNFLRGMYGNEEGFRDDAEVAMYWFANFFHNGQGSNLYSVLSTSRFHPGHSSKGPQQDSMEQMMYDDLVLQFAPDSEEGIEIQRERNSLNEGDEADAANDMWAGSDDDLSSYEVPPTTKQTSKKFFQGEKKKPSDVRDMDWVRIKKGIDKHTLGEEQQKEDPKDAMYVEYIGPWGNEKPFTLKTANGKEKFEYCKGKYPDGTEDIAVYAYRGDMCWGYKAWQKQYTSLQENSAGEDIRVDYGISGTKGLEPSYHQTPQEAWQAVETFMDKASKTKVLQLFPNGLKTEKLPNGMVIRTKDGNAVAIAVIHGQQ